MNWRTRRTKYSPSCPLVQTSGRKYRTVLTTGRDENTNCPLGNEHTIMFACCHRPSVHEYLLIWSSASDDVTFGTLRVICILQLPGYTLIWCTRHPTMPHVAISADTKMASKQTSSDQLVCQKPRKFATENPFG